MEKSLQQVIDEANARVRAVAPQLGIVSKEQIQENWDILSPAEQEGFR